GRRVGHRPAVRAGRVDRPGAVAAAGSWVRPGGSGCDPRGLPCGHRDAAVSAPDSKVATARGLRTETATSSLGAVLGVSGCDEDDLYAAMDWALARQERVENALSARHLANGTLVLYDVSSAAFEGRTCPLGAIGHA